MKELIFYGDDILVYDFPEQTRIFYAPKPLPPFGDEMAAIKEALENPIGSKRLEELLDENSQVVICFDDICTPYPQMKNDVRAIAAEVVLEKLRVIGIKRENLLFMCATGLHRKCKPKELAHILGKQVFREYRERIFNHDADDRENLVVLGKTKQGYDVEINRFAAVADLIIYLNITSWPMSGGWKSIIVGLGSFKTIIPNHSPEVLMKGSMIDTQVSGLHRIIWEMGRILKDKIQVFTIEMVLNNNLYSGLFEKLLRPLGENNHKLPLWRRIALSTIRRLGFLKSYLMSRYKANYRLVGVYVGNIEQAHSHTLKLVKKQLIVPIDKQYDVVILGIPNLTPYTIGSVMNPLILHMFVLGYFYNAYSGKPFLKKGGILIISNPAYEKFDPKQHPSYIDFYHQVLPRKPDIFNLKMVEKNYLDNEKYSEKYRTSYAYHGTHVLIAYYWGVLGLLKVGRVIIAGANSRRVLDLLGFDYAKTLDDAIEVSQKYLGENCSIAYFCMPPIWIAELEK
ncbi:MAG: lactate racemase domain-containing protein [Candidatus Hodarchaeota archaeon]